MSPTSRMRGLVLAAALACPAYAHALDLSMTFNGVVSPGSHGETTPYEDCCDIHTTSFDGQPVAISLSIAGTPGHLYVSHFLADWSNAPQTFPFVTNFNGVGFPDNGDNNLLVGFFSTVSLGSSGGSISIFPTFAYIGYTDNDFRLNLNYAFSHPRNPLGSFTDDGANGGGRIDAYVNFGWDPALQTYFLSGTSILNFSVTGMSQTSSIPDPAVWTLMIVGFAGVGLAMRRSRRELRAAA